MNGFSQVVDAPTRVTERSETLIDYVITNDSSLSVNVHLTPKISDHNLLSFCIDGRSVDNSDIIVHNRSMRNYSMERLQDYLLHVEWNRNSGDVNVLADSFVGDVEYFVNCICPVTKRAIKHNHFNKAWITDDVRENMKIRDNLYDRAVSQRNDVVCSEYKRVRNYVVTQIKIEKERFFKEIIDDNRQNPYEMWKKLKLLLPGKRSTDPDEIRFENRNISHESAMANEFNKYFLDSIDSIVAQSLNV